MRPEKPADADLVRRDPVTALRRIDEIEPQRRTARRRKRKMREYLLDRRRAAPPRRPRNGASAGRDGREFADPPRSARQFHGRGEQPSGRAAAGQKGAVRPHGKKRRPDLFGTLFLFGTAGIGLRGAAARSQADASKRDSVRNRDVSAGRSSRRCPSAPAHNRRAGRPESARAPPRRSRRGWRRSASRNANSRERMRAILPSTGAAGRPKAMAATAAAV